MRSAFAKILVFLAHFSRQDGACWPYPEGTTLETGKTKHWLRVACVAYVSVGLKVSFRCGHFSPSSVGSKRVTSGSGTTLKDINQQAIKL